jgi:hypothetical protein
VELVRAGEAALLMKGSLHTDELMAEVVHADTGLRTERRISHAYVMDVPGHPRPLVITDAAINITPTLEDKADIARNAIDLAHVIGIERPNVAIVAAVETVNPEDAGDAGCRRAVQDGGPGPDRRWRAGRAAGARQRHQRGGGAEKGSFRRWRGRRTSCSCPIWRPAISRRSSSRSWPGRMPPVSCWRARADHPDQPRGQRADADCLVRAGGAAGARRHKAAPGTGMRAHERKPSCASTPGRQA